MTVGIPLGVVHVEVCLNSNSTARYDAARTHVEEYLRNTVQSRKVRRTFAGEDFRDTPWLRSNVEFIQLCEVRGHDINSWSRPFEQLAMNIHVYQLSEQERSEEINEEEKIMTFNHWLLPSRELHGLWDSLVFEEEIQSRLLDYVYTSMIFADKGIDSNIISVNRVALFHGPPESGKLVMKMFQKIHSLAEDEESFVCVLIDEVESLTAARKASISGLEPSDSVRVVNALLTQIDQLRRKKNVLILTTSNVTEAIDAAFIDRADIKQYIGNPTQKAIYAILESCLQELMRCGLITPPQALRDWREVELFARISKDETPSGRLFATAAACFREGFSGRTLRKLPFVAHAFFLSQSVTSTLEEYLAALQAAVENEKSNRELMEGVVPQMNNMAL
ncbi:Pachytene checkpoint protein 2 [Rhizophlyctis rosea]|nr:Pachytene checkpoint protein 2 [Rhizophlyctis rosea]